MVSFTNEADPDDCLDITTEPDGRARAELTQGATYVVEVSGDEWEWWELAQQRLTVPHLKADEAIAVTLVPRDDLWLVALRLWRQRPGGQPVAGAEVTVTGPAAGDYREFHSRDDGYVFAVAPQGDIVLGFGAYDPPAGGRLLPRDDTVDYSVQAQPDVDADDIVYLGAIRLSVEPAVALSGGGTAALTGADVTVTYRGSELVSAFTMARRLAAGAQTVPFEFRFPGVYQVTVTPPPVVDGWPVEAGVKTLPSRHLGPGASRAESAHFRAVPGQQVKGNVQTPGGKQLDQDLSLEFTGDGGILIRRPAGTGGPFGADVPAGVALTISLDPSAGVPAIEGIPLEMSTPGQDLVPDSDNVIELRYQHAIIGNAVDEAGNPLSNAVIDVFDDKQQLVRRVVADSKGSFTVGLTDSGDYFVAVHTTDGGESVPRAEVSVKSPPARLPKPLVARRGGGAGGGGAGGGAVREAFTDLASYPVLTEEVSTTGIPGPALGGGAGTAGADYGQVVDQVMRDVLGWRPSVDVAGFQAALTGAFTLREVEGHTEWTWQQRGYAVQADMGALAGAQASIHARAKSALDQILPLLAGLTPLNPALYPPQDLEAIRTVINSELQELVGELALDGGPRIQRVDQLFHLLTGDQTGSRNLNPDVVGGNLGTLRDRFGLTVDEIDTVEEERVVTNFRIVVEQVLSLQASWSADRGLLTPFDPRAAFGTVLIWLSRSLEAVVDSVNDLTFAMDSVFVDAAQRQVIELRLPGEGKLFLSDLLDWVLRAARDEGPRIITDAGKDGVFAFAPVLRKLSQLVEATRGAAQRERRLPDGLRTPRVDRALQVLVAQLGEATLLAGQIRSDTPPDIAAAPVFDLATNTEVTLATLSGRPASIQVNIRGSNFRPNASAVLIAQDREDLPELHTRSIQVTPPTSITATFRNPTTVPGGAGVTWLVAVINEDGTPSTQIPI
jgi:hypothetical protein